MAIYHLSIRTISRSSFNGKRSCVAAAAYRAGERLRDERYNRSHNYANRKGVAHSEILLPSQTPAWMGNREQLWNAVEAQENRKDAQLSREVVFALPCELERGEQIRLAQDYVQSNFVDKGMVADVNIHDMGDGNPHAHVMLTMRGITPDGFGKKAREWNSKECTHEWRKSWADKTNAALEQVGREERIDHRTLKEQGIDRIPQEHRGPEKHGGKRREPPRYQGEKINMDMKDADPESIVQNLLKVQDDIKQQLDLEAEQRIAVALRVQTDKDIKRTAQKMQKAEAEGRRLAKRKDEQQDRIASARGRLRQAFEATFQNPDAALRAWENAVEKHGFDDTRFLLERNPKAFGDVKGWNILGIRTKERREADKHASFIAERDYNWRKTQDKLAQYEQEGSSVLQAARHYQEEHRVLQERFEHLPDVSGSERENKGLRKQLYGTRAKLLKHITLEDIQKAELSDQEREDLERLWQDKQEKSRKQELEKGKAKEKGREL